MSESSGIQPRDCKEVTYPQTLYRYTKDQLQVEKHGGKKTLEIFCRPVIRQSVTHLVDTDEFQDDPPDPVAPVAPEASSHGIVSKCKFPLQVETPVAGNTSTRLMFDSTVKQSRKCNVVVRPVSSVSSLSELTTLSATFTNHHLHRRPQIAELHQKPSFPETETIYNCQIKNHTSNCQKSLVEFIFIKTKNLPVKTKKLCQKSEKQNVGSVEVLDHFNEIVPRSNQMKSRRAEADCAVDQAVWEVEVLKSSLNMARLELELRESASQLVLNDLTAARSELESTRRARDWYQDQLQEARSSIQQLASDLLRVREENSELQARIETKSLVLAHHGFLRASEKSTAFRKEKQQDCENYNRLLTSAEGDILNSQMMLLKDSMLDSKTSRIQDLEAEVASLRQICANYSQSLEAKDALISELTSKANNKNSSVSLSNLCIDGSVEFMNLGKVSSTFRLQKEAEDEKRSDLEAALGCLTAEIDVLKGRIKEYADEKELTEETHARLLEQLEALRSEKDILNEDHESLKRKYFQLLQDFEGERKDLDRAIQALDEVQRGIEEEYCRHSRGMAQCDCSKERAEINTFGMVAGKNGLRNRNNVVGCEPQQCSVRPGQNSHVIDAHVCRIQALLNLAERKGKQDSCLSNHCELNSAQNCGDGVAGKIAEKPTKLENRKSPKISFLENDRTQQNSMNGDIVEGADEKELEQNLLILIQKLSDITQCLTEEQAVSHQLREIVTSLTYEQEQDRTRLCSLREELAQERNCNNQLQQRMQILSQEQNDSLSRLERLLEEKVSNCSVFQNKITLLEEELEKENTACVSANEQYSSLLQEFEGKKIEMATLAQKLDESKATENQIRQELRTANQKINHQLDDFQQELEKEKSGKDKTMQNLKDLFKELEQLESVRVQLVGQLSEISLQLEKERTAYQQIMQQLTDVTQELEQERFLKKQFKQQCAFISQQLEQERSDKLVVIQELSGLNKVQEQERLENQQIGLELADLNSELESIRSDRHQAFQQLTDVTLKLEQECSEKLRFVKLNKDLSELLEQERSARQQLIQNLSDCEIEILEKQQATQQLTNISQDLEKERSVIKLLEKTVDNLDEELAQEKSLKDQILTQLSDLCQELEKERFVKDQLSQQLTVVCREMEQERSAKQQLTNAQAEIIHRLENERATNLQLEHKLELESHAKQALTFQINDERSAQKLLSQQLIEVNQILDHERVAHQQLMQEVADLGQKLIYDKSNNLHKLANLNDELERVRSSEQAMRQELNKLSESLDNEESYKKQMRQELANLSEELVKEKSAVTQLQDELISREVAVIQERSSYEEKIQAFQITEEDLKRKMAYLDGQKIIHQEQLVQLNEALKISVDHIRSLRSVMEEVPCLPSTEEKELMCLFQLDSLDDIAGTGERLNLQSLRLCLADLQADMRELNGQLTGSNTSSSQDLRMSPNPRERAFSESPLCFADDPPAPIPYRTTFSQPSSPHHYNRKINQHLSLL